MPKFLQIEDVAINPDLISAIKFYETTEDEPLPGVSITMVGDGQTFPISFQGEQAMIFRRWWHVQADVYVAS